MHRISLHRLVPALALLVSLAAGACGDDPPTEDGVGSCAAALRAGQLVITEIMPDPAGADDNGIEWFEVHNPGPDEVSLAEVGLEFSKVDGTDGKGYRIPSAAELTLAPGAYMTFGRVTDDMRPEHIDHGYGSAFAMGNTGGKLRLVCGKVVLDSALYEDLSDGVSRQLDARVAPPDPEANDILTNWCDSDTALGADEFGTPRAANTRCPLVVEGCGQCYEGDELRDAIAPRPGQLVINELMPNASSAPESRGEWFELYVADGPVDLNCLQYGGNTTKFTADPKDAKVLSAPQCLTVDAGEFVIFGDQKKWPEADHNLGFTLVDSKTSTNPDPGLYVAFGDVILDEIHYPKTYDGVAWSLDPDLATPTANDDFSAAFCKAVDVFVAAELGTPGAANPQCPTVCPADSCFEGDTCRAIDFLAPGELLITEVFPDPGSNSPDGEWFEILVGADADLNGLTIGKALSPTPAITDPTCRTVTAGTTVLVAASADAAVNGGITPDLVAEKLSLTNSSSSLVLGTIRSDGTNTELDSVSWATTHDGKAHQLTIESVPADAPFDVAINDTADVWCDANVQFGVGDWGTPGLENTSCAAPPPADATCLDGDTPRKVRFPVVGDLLITEIHADPKALLEQNPGSGEPKGEWLELWVAADVDLNGLQLGSPGLKYTLPVGDAVPCVAVTRGTFAVLTRDGGPTDPPALAQDPLNNGGIPAPNATYGGLSLSNSGATVTIGVGGTELDSVTFVKPSVGKSQQLGNTACLLDEAPLAPGCNDVQSDWCPATKSYGLGDFGTPAADNDACNAAPGPNQCFDTVLGMNRDIVAPGPGDIIVTEFLANPSGTETDREWVELRAKAAVDLNNLKVLGAGEPPQSDIDVATPACVSNVCVPLAVGDFVLLAKKTDPNLNGNLPAVDCVLVPSLSNSNDGVAIAHGATLVDGVTWKKTQAEDRSTMLPPAGENTTNIDTDIAPWCVAADAGTPKQENPSCP